jgi:hypothetical protein
VIHFLEMMRRLRNAFLGIGAYYASQWLSVLVAFLLRLAARQLASDDYTVQAFTRALITAAPDAVGAAAAGIIVALLVDSPRPATWTLLPAALLFASALNEALVATQTWWDSILQVATATLPPLVCIGAGQIATRHRP